jgi:thiol-disulfide isomerase/thioredoxin
MVATYSTMIPLQTPAPDFALLDVVSGKKRNLVELKSNIATVIMFICNHCPFVKLVRHELVKIAHDYQLKGIRFIAINSNDPQQYPDDAPEIMKEIAEVYSYPFPYLFDETQEVAKAYHAACTPDFYVFDGNLKCVYRGQLDDARPGNNQVPNGRDLRQVLDCLLTHIPISPHQKPSMGCNIKWRVEPQD